MDAQNHGHEEHHGPSVRMYFAIFGALCILTIATVVTAKIDFAPLVGNNALLGSIINNGVALGIACTKAALVILFFMHVKYENKLIGLAVISSVIWLLFLILITYSDYGTRDHRAWQLWVPGS